MTTTLRQVYQSQSGANTLIFSVVKADPLIGATTYVIDWCDATVKSVVKDWGITAAGVLPSNSAAFFDAIPAFTSSGEYGSESGYPGLTDLGYQDIVVVP